MSAQGAEGVTSLAMPLTTYLLVSMLIRNEIRVCCTLPTDLTEAST